jgi:uncharacterized membrane protein YhaH (DUF805 family)
MKDLSPIRWALRPLKRYAEFSGRSSRAELWWFVLFLTVAYVAMTFVLMAVVGTSVATASQSSSAMPAVAMIGAFGLAGILMLLFWLAMLIPMLAVQVRRLHDINRSGWWLGGFYLLYVVYFALMFGSLASAMSAAAAGGGASATPPNSAMFSAVMVLGLLMFVYGIALLVFYCLAGTKGPNRFGDDPYGANVEEVFA